MKIEDIIDWQSKINGEYEKEFIDWKSKSLVFNYICDQLEENCSDSEASSSEESEYSDDSQSSGIIEPNAAKEKSNVEMKGLLRIDLKYLCDGCGQEICMKCGENNWHLNQRKCLNYIEGELAKKDKVVQWKMQNW